MGTRQDIIQISEIMIKQLKDRMKEKEITLIVKDPIKHMLVEQGFDPIYGARPLRRAVINILEDNLACEFLAKPLYPKTKLIVDVDLENKVVVTVNYDHVDPKLLPKEETKE